MIFYLYYYLSSFLITLITLRNININRNKNYEKYVLFIIIFITIIIISLRYETGGDWKRYLYLYSVNSEVTFMSLWSWDEPLYKLISFLTYEIYPNQINLFQFVCCVIFFSSVTPFLISQKSPMLAFTFLLFPGIYIVLIGFERQALALGVLMLAYTHLNNKNNVHGIILIIISFLLHKSAIIFYPLIIFIFINYNFSLFFRQFWFYIFNIAMIILLYFITSLDLTFLDKAPLFNSYIQDNNSSNSRGVFFRLIPTFISIFIYSFYIYKNNLRSMPKWIDYNYLIGLFVIYFTFFGFLTLADRINYYLIPFNIFLLISICFDKNNNIVISKIYLCFIMYLVMLLIWLGLSEFSYKMWQPFMLVF
jgi:hypothetical protein